MLESKLGGWKEEAESNVICNEVKVMVKGKWGDESTERGSVHDENGAAVVCATSSEDFVIMIMVIMVMANINKQIDK